MAVTESVCARLKSASLGASRRWSAQADHWPQALQADFQSAQAPDAARLKSASLGASRHASAQADHWPQALQADFQSARSHLRYNDSLE